MLDLLYGKLTDSLFLDSLIGKATVRMPGLILLKPCDGGNVMPNWEYLDTLLKAHHFVTKVDTLDPREEQFFNNQSVFKILPKEPLKLFLPKGEDEKEAPDTSANRLVVLMPSDQEYFVYNGTRVANGRSASFEDIKAYLSARNKKHEISVVIKPGKKCSYQSVVNILDLMTTTNVKNYSWKIGRRRKKQLFIHKEK